VPGTPVAPKRRHRVRNIVVALVLIPALLLGGLFAYGWVKYDQIPKVDVSDAVKPAVGGGTNYLIVGTDSRAGITANDPNAGAILGGQSAASFGGARTDSIMVLRIADGHQTLLSIPRDLYVTDPSTGKKDRINTTFASGPANLITAVNQLGIPIQHYLEIDFVAFSQLVDAVGGIDIPFAFPARDLNSGLNVPSTGVVHLDGTQALAYVRARHYEELKGGKWVTDPTSDLGRVMRQRAFLTALMSKVASTRNPITLNGITASLAVGMRVDTGLSYFGALGLAWTLRSFQPESVTLPTTPRTAAGGAAVLDLQTAAAKPIISQFSN
jgi:LCP family protein required for cell wall assembly